MLNNYMAKGAAKEVWVKEQSRYFYTTPCGIPVSTHEDLSGHVIGCEKCRKILDNKETKNKEPNGKEKE